MDYVVLHISLVNYVNIKQAINTAEFCQFRSFVFCKEWWDIQQGFCCKFLGEYKIERILKNGQHLSKL